MTREEAKELLPFIQAFAEGKTIQYKNEHGSWIEIDCPIWSKYCQYRIKPESKYRPFKNQEECWQEILKHRPFGWIKIPNGDLFCIDKIFDKGITYDNSCCSFEECVCNYTFTDDTPFGIETKE